MTPTAYLALMATARPLYIWLYQDAISILPPVDPEAPVYRKLEVHTGLDGIAKAIGWGRDVVRKEMARLVNYGWVQGARAPRLLGHREGRRLYLLADLTAEQLLGEANVVSVNILGATKPVEVESRRDRGVPQGLEGRGTNRKWTGFQGTWGGK